MTLRIVAAAAAVFLLSGASSPAEDWSRFRGPNGSGVSESGALPAEFGPEKNLLWRTEVPFGRSSPIVVKNRIYISGSDGEKLITMAIDRSTGRIEWRREVPRDRDHKFFKTDDTAAPTPVSDGTNVYVFFYDLGILSYGPDGNERWRVKLGPFDSFYGVPSSPVLAGNRLLQVCDQRSGSFIQAIDKDSGKVLWKKDRTQAKTEAYSTPAVYTPPKGSPLVVVSGPYRLDAYDPATGEIVWFAGNQGTYPISAPVIVNGVVFASSMGAEEPMFEPFDKALEKLDKNKDGKINREELAEMKGWEEHFGWLDANKDGQIDRAEWEYIRKLTVSEHGLRAVRLGGTGDQTANSTLWRVKKNAPYIVTPVIYNGVVYSVTDNAIATSIDAGSGKVHKVARLKDAMGEYFASPVAGDGKVYFTSAEGKVSVLKAQADWEVIAVNDLKEECSSTPAIAGGRLYFRTHKALYGFGEKN